MSNASGSDQLTSIRGLVNRPASTSTVPGVAELLGRSKLYTLLAKGFAYPDEDLRRSLTALLGELQETARSLPNSEGLLSALAPLETAIAEVAPQPQRSEAPLAGLEEEYTYLFARNAVCPPNEVSYNPEPNWGSTRDLADLSGFYTAFGFGVSGQAGERADYISVEMEFMALLCLKESYALERGWGEKAEICREARKKFVGEHLWRWLPQFGLRVRPCSNSVLSGPGLGDQTLFDDGRQPCPRTAGELGRGCMTQRKNRHCGDHSAMLILSKHEHEAARSSTSSGWRPRQRHPRRVINGLICSATR